MTTEFNKRFLSILQHTIGFDEYGESRDPSRPEGFRNHFVASEGHHDWQYIQQMLKLGLMKERPATAISGGSPWFFVTEAGRQYVKTHSAKRPKLTRGQERYQRFLHLSDVMPDLTFHEFVRRRLYLDDDKREVWLRKESDKRLAAYQEEQRKIRETYAGVQEELNKWKERYGIKATEIAGTAGSGAQAPGA